MKLVGAVTKQRGAEARGCGDPDFICSHSNWSCCPGTWDRWANTVQTCLISRIQSRGLHVCAWVGQGPTFIIVFFYFLFKHNWQSKIHRSFSLMSFDNITHLCEHHPDKIEELFIIPGVSLWSFPPSLLPTLGSRFWSFSPDWFPVPALTGGGVFLSGCCCSE